MIKRRRNSSMRFLRSCRNGPMLLPVVNRKMTSRSWRFVSSVSLTCRRLSRDDQQRLGLQDSGILIPAYSGFTSASDVKFR
jgi:hypothetical protein